MADRGWFGIDVPEEYGGLGRDYLSYILAIEELARIDASHAITVSAHSTLGTSPIVNFGTDEQKRRYVPLLAGARSWAASASPSPRPAPMPPPPAPPRSARTATIA
jgi:alkylation response protein AidB-like acyl-CoA dehydrogenase